MLRYQLVQGRDPGQPLQHSTAGQHPARFVFDLDVMVGHSPIVANKQHRASPLTYLINKPRTAERTCCNLMDQCSTGTTSHQHYRSLTNRRGTI
jgi:hypothetical protein